MGKVAHATSMPAIKAPKNLKQLQKMTADAIRGPLDTDDRTPATVQPIAEAIIKRPVRIATRTGIFAQLLYAVAPRLYEVIMNTAFRMFPDSAAAKGMKGRAELEQQQPTSEQVAFASIMRGVHW